MEENAKKFNLNMKLLLPIGAAALVLLVLLAVLLPGNIREELTVEAGTEHISANDFRKEDKGIDAAFASDMTGVDLSTPGTYPVQIL